jgi:hypothetical protein
MVTMPHIPGSADLPGAVKALSSLQTLLPLFSLYLCIYVYIYAYVPRYMCARDEYKSHNHLLPLLAPGPTTYDLRLTNYDLQRHRRPVYTIISYISLNFPIQTSPPV